MRESPDKKLPPFKSMLRKILRECRWFKVILLNRGKVERGSNCYFGRNAEVYVPSKIVIGDNVSIGSDWISQVNLNVADDCLISSRVSFIGHDHELYEKEFSSYFSGRCQPSFIRLEGNNFIGFGATVLGDVVIGKDAVVAAQALVTKDVPANAVVAGVPAKFVKNRY